jgi:glycosyltransferase involved in cell wall biosynthesis
MKNQNNATRIFVDCHVFDGGFQGTRTYIRGLYKELIKDHSRHFFFAASDVAILKAEFGESSNVTFLQYQSKSKMRRLLVETPQLIRKHKIEFAHFQYRVPPIKCCKYIVTTHDVLFEDFPEYFPVLNRIQSLLTYKISARISDIVFTVSEYSKTQIATYLGVKNAVVMPNGLDSVFFEDYDKDAVKMMVSEKFGLQSYLIYVSRKEPRKNQHLLLQYFVELELYKSRQLVLVGHETFKNNAFSSVYDSLDATIKKQIILIDHADFSQMLTLLRGADAFIYPSIAEGFGIPPLEAAAAKIPVLCSNQTAMSDFDFFGSDLFNPFDESEFKQKLHTIATTPPKPEKLESIREIISEKYNWQNAAAIFYRELEGFL